MLIKQWTNTIWMCKILNNLEPLSIILTLGTGSIDTRYISKLFLEDNLNTNNNKLTHI